MVGNPGDYVHGQRGLDAIISRLMEQEGKYVFLFFYVKKY